MAQIESFDHSRYVQLPEYEKALRALDALAHALPKDITVDEFHALVTDVTVSLPYSDMCTECRAKGDYKMYPPYIARVEGNDLNGLYRCQNGHTWRCYYAVDIHAHL